jgi:non-canonical purine NTP pyrophosphatase (RdgB/HAM1 family)
LLLGSGNPGKIRELRCLLQDLKFDLRDLTEVAPTTEVRETGNTFEENASLKAIGYARQTKLLTLADDSGLEVDALRGGPGVLSARYGGEGASDLERTGKLLAQIASVSDDQRTARFVSVVAIADETARIIQVAMGICQGRLAREPRGSAGFGYDPIFVPDGYDRTFGELPAVIKNQISHRARALGQARNFLRSLTE